MASIASDDSIASGDGVGFVSSKGEARRVRLLPDPRHVWMVFRRRQWLFGVIACLVFSAVVAAVLLAKPVYVATASVLIEPRKSDTIDLQSVVQGLPADTNVVDTQTQIIASPATSLAVVRQLHLDREADFVGDAALRGTSSARSARQPDALAADPDRSMSTAERRAATILQGLVTVRRQGLTYVIDIAAKSSDPRRATEIANAFAAQYIAMQADHRAGVTEQAAQFVSHRAEELRQQAVTDDAAVQNYMIAHNLMSAEGATMAEQEASQLNQQITQAQATLAQERGKLAAARAQLSRGGGSDIGAVLASETIRALRAQEATASAEVASLASHYGESHPEMQRARQNLADVREQLAAEQQRIISTLQANVQVAQSGLDSLQASRVHARTALASNGTAQVGLLELQRKAEASRTIYSAFLQRAKETAAAANLPQADASISSLARLPDAPVWPNYHLGMAFGLVGAVVCGLLAVGLAEYLDGSIATRDQVEGELGATYAGALPDLRVSAGREHRHTAPYLYIMERPFSVFAEAVRAAGATVLRPRGRGAQVIAVTSALPREGKTTFSICLARILAAGGRSVVLVDGDLRRHSVSSTLLPEQGADERLLAVLEGRLPIDQALVRDPLVDMMILPTAGPRGTEDYLTDERVKALYAALRERFEVVIVDTAPVLGIVDTRTLSAHADATMMVCRWRKTAIRAAQAAIDILDQAGVRMLAVGLSQVNIRQYASAGQNDVYGYQKKFAGYYVS
ncbi:uncharacterized protein involved in exopolysaccharide biosynthesis [Novosphingobium sp. PhB165]|uniref:GumC family protein n=1 Tax=Novosphingobium sp. PhB165 TaxID=2485105 RepID=UPI0010465D4F|nr:polysaccharide biosynthesis tyrosine autokinase [Novosphingobium sp. PhB165]TCM17979.1 uncharacterized protein involved in exopolysaccharide biosynthesis [Novosphingobium sp. PhB165]